MEQVFPARQTWRKMIHMETTLTTWEEKERAGLLALETDEWREKRIAAEDPNTTADVLEHFSEEALGARKEVKHRNEVASQRTKGEYWRKSDLLLESLAVHPNTPPCALAEIVDVTPLITRAFCHNPITPFLLLEEPNFLTGLGSVKQQYLLCHTDAPLLYVRMLTMKNSTASHWTQKAAQMHVALAGEVATVNEWRRQVCDFWRGECARAEDPMLRHWYADFVEMGLVPSWANGSEPPAVGLVSFYFAESLDKWFQCQHPPGSAEEEILLKRICARIQDKDILARALRSSATSADICALLHTPSGDTRIAHHAVLRHPLVQRGYLGDAQAGQQSLSNVLMYLVQSLYPDVRRLARRHPDAPANAAEISRAAFIQHVEKRRSAPPELGVFIASLYKAYQQKDLPDKADSGHWTHRLEAALLANAWDNSLLIDDYGRTARDLLQHLAHDGNRLVRWAAQTRLADPDFVFTWHEDDE